MICLYKLVTPILATCCLPLLHVSLSGKLIFFLSLPLVDMPNPSHNVYLLKCVHIAGCRLATHVFSENGVTLV